MLCGRRCRIGGDADWFAGEITKVCGGGMYDILYEDGDSEEGVARELIRVAAATAQAEAPAPAPAAAAPPPT